MQLCSYITPTVPCEGWSEQDTAHPSSSGGVPYKLGWQGNIKKPPALPILCVNRKFKATCLKAFSVYIHMLCMCIKKGKNASILQKSTAWICLNSSNIGIFKASSIVVLITSLNILYRSSWAWVISDRWKTTLGRFIIIRRCLQLPSSTLLCRTLGLWRWGGSGP